MARDNVTKIFILGSIFLVGLTVLSIPKWRYLFPMIPIFIMSASWYGKKIRNFIKYRWIGLSKLMQDILITLIILCGSLVLCHSQVLSWARLTYHISKNSSSEHSKILEAKANSLKGAYYQLSKLTKNCKGIMTLEGNFLGAFIEGARNRIYDPWEIPPFGQLNSSVYKGLNPSRIDCVLVSSDMATAVGSGTNLQIRYQNYIKPYLDQLHSLGALTYEIPNYGQAIILSY